MRRAAAGSFILAGLAAFAPPAVAQSLPVTWDDGPEGWADAAALSSWSATGGYQGSGGVVLPASVTSLSAGDDLHLPLSGFRLLVRQVAPADPVPAPVVQLEARIPDRSVACIPGCLRVIYPAVRSGRDLGGGWFEYKSGPAIVVGSERLCGREPSLQLTVHHRGEVAIDQLDLCREEIEPVVISGVLPPRGSAAGGTVVVVRGSRLVGGSRVYFGPAASRARLVSDPDRASGAESVLVTVTPPGPEGAVDVLALNPDGGRGELSAGFRYEPAGPDPVVEPPGPAVPPRESTIDVGSGDVLGGGAALIAFGRLDLAGPGANARAVDVATGADVTVAADLDRGGLLVFADAGQTLRVEDGPPAVASVTPGVTDPGALTCVTIVGQRLAGAFSAALATPGAPTRLVGEPRVNAAGTRLSGLCVPAGLPPGEYELLVSTPLFRDVPTGVRVVVTFPPRTGAGEGIFRRDAPLAPDSLSGPPYAVFRGRARFVFKAAVLADSPVTLRLLLRQNTASAAGALAAPRLQLAGPGVATQTLVHAGTPDSWEEHVFQVTPTASGVLRLHVDCAGADATNEVYLDDLRVEQEAGRLTAPAAAGSGPVRQATDPSEVRSGTSALGLAAGASHTLRITSRQATRVTFFARPTAPGAGLSAALTVADNAWRVDFAPHGAPDAGGWQQYVAESPPLTAPTVLQLRLAATGTSGEVLVDDVRVEPR